MNAPRLASRLARLAALLGAVAFATCGVKGPPRPPPGAEDQVGKRDGEPLPPGCEQLEPPQVVPAGKSTEEICDACAELREKRRRCGVKEPLGDRCRALCLQGERARDLDPGQDLEGRQQPMRSPARSPPDGGADDGDQDGGTR